MFSVETAMMKPTMTMHLQMVMCSVRSFQRPDVHAMAIPMPAARRYGGHVRTRAMVLLSVRVLMTVGRKFWKPTDDR